MSAMRGIFPCEGNGLSSAAPEPLRKRRARVPLHHPGTLRLPCDQTHDDPWRFFIDDLKTGAGVPLPPTADNEVRYLVDAPVYFADLAAEISAAGDPATKGTFASDFVYLIGWYFALDFPLVPDTVPSSPHPTIVNAPSPKAMESSLSNLLLGAAKRGAEIRLLVWGKPFDDFSKKVAAEISDMRSDAGERLNTFAIADKRLLLTGAHHQKLVVVRRNLKLTGYCGGIDLNQDRLFPMHIEGQRETLNKSIDRGDPYHDVQCRIRGPGTGYLLRTFSERWHDHMSHDPDPVTKLAYAEQQLAEAEALFKQLEDEHGPNLDGEVVEMVETTVEFRRKEAAAAKAAIPIPPLCIELHPAPPAPNPAGNDAFASRQIVQIGRTFGDPICHGARLPFGADLQGFAPLPASDSITSPHRDPNTYDFAPHGEQTIKLLLLKAIALAKRFIYVEDQYLIDEDIAHAVAAALSRGLAHFTAMIPLDEDLETSFRADVATGFGLPWIDLPFKAWKNHAIGLRNRFINIVERAGGDRARIFTHRVGGDEHTYVHSKMWIVDDEFVLIGSANCNLRSLTHDGEICAAIADQPRLFSCGLNLPRRLRMALWAEHLGMDDPEGHAELVDGVASAVHWLESRHPLEGRRPAGARITRRVEGLQDTPEATKGTRCAKWLLKIMIWAGLPLKVVKLALDILQAGKGVIDEALVPLLFEPVGSCSRSNIHQHDPPDPFAHDWARLEKPGGLRNI